MVYYYRLLTLAASLLLTFLAASLFFDYVASDDLEVLDLIRVALLAVTSFGIAWGASLAFSGLFAGAPKAPTLPGLPTKRTAVLVPIYNEDPFATFSRISAMDESLVTTGAEDVFDFVVLSDTRNDDIAAEEEAYFLRLVEERRGKGRMFYRRRPVNHGRKAGNIADFVRRSGAAYDFLLVLDADSLVEGETMVELARRMEAAPDVGLIQTLPKVINAKSLFGRSMQFASWFFAPAFSRGLAAVQGGTGAFWGHNAIIRTEAFAACCGLPRLSGKPPFGGDILSHDYVEAVLLSRGGWKLRLDTDLEGSYEEAPDDLMAFAKRDRRWCQGNLQHIRLLIAPGLPLWSRYFLLQGIMAYLASPLWLAFLVTSIMAPFFATGPVYFPEQGMLFPRFPHVDTSKALMLLATVAALLILPRLLILARASGQASDRGFSGTASVAWSTIVEVLWSSVMAPIMLLFQSRAVLQIVTGADGGWPVSARDEGVSLGEAWSGSWWMSAIGILTLTVAGVATPELLPWLLPVGVPMVLAPLVIYASATPRSGLSAARVGLFATPAELTVPRVVDRHRSVISRWGGRPPEDAEIPDAETTAIPTSEVEPGR
ncbi:glucans biosynthesis glucosyltransferase MdoH [Amorphus orientalis]|uniref:Glucans biosynthesis glucosyltransferase H n=1 Tax=Amorphus orientalis TaxID=649198 RepID=A0AAE3VLP4_9HYPH|nr:glucans biosynthesis glucosyltransferase MdoH [Amorphus orientalis]MDQ0314050.1 membrane glycosyltransferase [Amorphus orientalis]